MEVIHFKVKGGNFGDNLNDYIWQLLLPNIQELPSNEAILGIGTLQNKRISPNIKRIHVFGSGALNSNASDWLKKNNFEFHFVRGPLTAKQWGCSEKSLIDGAALILHTNLKNIPLKKSKKIGYIPHHTSDQQADFNTISNHANMEYISTRGFEIEKFISQVKSCDFIITEALHGAIIADLFRKPWLPVSSGYHIYSFKWDDWCKSIDLNYSPHCTDRIITRGIKPIVRFENIFKRSLSFVNIGKERWASKRICYDNKEKEGLIAEQLVQIKNNGNWILSKEKKIDELVNRSGEIFRDFKKRYGKDI
ncbi:Polysaccharide pyruvyl transferase [Candidatus Methylopumilus planktonicus]|uniref:polysaccharide pyruvyl transferase family protein n=1 Tax=Candidatus Methylopumilus planktonicus TaxID=1581557 RepID=UPI003BEEB641